jgi:hypothetical protein
MTLLPVLTEARQPVAHSYDKLSHAGAALPDTDTR